MFIGFVFRLALQLTFFFPEQLVLLVCVLYWICFVKKIKKSKFFFVLSFLEFDLLCRDDGMKTL